MSVHPCLILYRYFRLDIGSVSCNATSSSLIESQQSDRGILSVLMRSIREKRRDRRRNLDSVDTDESDEGMSLLGQGRGFSRMEEDEYGTEYEGKIAEFDDQLTGFF